MLPEFLMWTLRHAPALGLTIVLAVAAAYLMATARDSVDELDEREERLRIERWTRGTAPGVPVRRSQVRVARDGKPSVQAELDRIRRAEGAGSDAA